MATPCEGDFVDLTPNPFSPSRLIREFNEEQIRAWWIRKQLRQLKSLGLPKRWVRLLEMHKRENAPYPWRDYSHVS